ncbi:MAG: type VI secretion system baseplate subunit TssG [Proteobacteria bacterium]|nr:MAG: type VI secretion system baseplate subunit TssG [Pseudomonadota bacterium]
MASTGGTSQRAVALFRALERAPYRFSFFQALRRIECAFRDRPRLGESRHPATDPIRLAQEASVAFAPSNLTAFEREEGQPAPRLVSRFLGLFGPNGPLPLHLTEYARDRLRNSGDVTFSRFADLFHHRILSLFYRAFANAEPTVSYDRPESDRWATYVGSLVGAGMPSFAGRDGLPDVVRLYYAGHFSAQPKNAEGLTSIVKDLFAVPTRVEEYIPAWVEVPEDSRWRLGSAGLGQGTMLGARALLHQEKFRVVIGPIDQRRFLRLLPGTEDFTRLRSLVRSYVGDHLDWDVKLILDEDTRRPWRLGLFSRLGWTTALGKFRGPPPSIIVNPREG